MTYEEFIKPFIEITKDEWDEVAQMFYNYEITEDMVINLGPDSTKEDLIAEIIYSTVDPNCEYIDDINIDSDNVIRIYEISKELEDLELFRDNVKLLLASTPYSPEFV